MEYIVSARKYRPMTFDSVVGQSSLTTTLRNAVTSGKLAHAYLFCGPRGVGKTTCARIFAKAINCEHPAHNGEACGECESCKAFNEQRSYNIFELDAASNNSVESIKTLMEQTRIPPQVGQYKVFIIDEVHMLSTAAFNAFLKTLEEPPAYVIFILATTEKHKILPTILSRCQIYDFSRMSVQGIVNHLKMVAKNEGIEAEESALNVIAEKADGGMRDALSIFDQAVSFCGGQNLTYAKVIEDLNVLDTENYFRVIDNAVKNEVTDIMLLLDGVIQKGFDTGQFALGLAAHVRNVLMARDPQTLPLLEVSDDMRKRYAQQAQQCPIAFLYKTLKLLNNCDINYRQSSNKRLLVELTLIQIAQITQPDDADSSGRSPKALKILFKKITMVSQPQQKTAQQVAGTEKPQQVADTTKVAVTQPEHAHTNAANSTNNAAQPVNTATPKGNIGIKLSSLGGGISLNSLTKTGTTIPAIAQQAKANTQETNSVELTQELLNLHWLAMCNRMIANEKYKILGIRMKNVQVNHLGGNDAEIVANNEPLKNEIAALLNIIRDSISRDMHTSVNFTIRVAEMVEVRKYMSELDIYKEMLEKDDTFKFMNKVLALELQ